MKKIGRTIRSATGWLKRGFTLIELVMVILLLAILAAIAIPNFIDFRTDAKNAATNGALGALRAAVAVATASIALREDPTTNLAKYPTLLEMQGNAFDGSHPVLSGTNIVDASAGIPKNPWTLGTLPTAHFNSIFPCPTKSNVLSTSGLDDRGWCYKASTGEIWANSDQNAGGSGKTENAF